MTTIDTIRAALSRFEDRYLGTDLVAAGVVNAVDLDGDRASVRLQLGFPANRYHDSLRQTLSDFLMAQTGLASVEVQIDTVIATHAVRRQLKPIPGVSNVVAVASAKGGVGKSTTAANLAVALAADGASVGILDADIYGPSQPRILGLQDQRPSSRDGKSLEPLEAHGVRCMSIGFLVDPDQPMVWRGPMVTQALTQLLSDTHWGDIDYLIVDMPPGTGDIQLTLSQRVPVSGAVIVTTPQELALLDARKGLQMFRKVEVRVLGIVENMSTHICSSCGHEEPVFGSDGGQHMAEQYDAPFLGSLPLDIRIREQTDAGVPEVAAHPDSAVSAAYFDIARRMSAGLAAAGKDYSRLFPNIVVEE
ncbi:MAG: iron-sulfur cluster carrier protein ApbC [Gammaproteobacteria bacterium]|nr:iron-sulfur cluster carrier protein ApbC [Gammaproteobacteria bacterium]